MINKRKNFTVIHVTNWSPLEVVGGLETILNITSKFQAGNGDNVHIVSLRENRYQNIIKKDGVVYYEIGTSFKRSPSTKDLSIKGKIHLYLELFYVNYKLALTVLNLCLKEKPDAVIFYFQFFAPMSILLRIAGYKTFLGLYVVQNSIKRLTINYLLFFLVMKSFNACFTHAKIFNSKEGLKLNNMEILKSFFGNNVFYIPWGIDIKGTEKASNSVLPKYSKGKTLVICSRRLVEEKGVRVLLEAIPEVLGKFKNVLFLFTSEGYLKPLLVKRARELRISNSVILTGVLNRKTTLALIKNSKVMVVPSSGEENFGMIFLEGYALRTPIVSTTFGGITNVVKNGKTGILVKPQNVSELAAAIIKLLSFRELRERFTENGRQRLERLYDINTTIDKLNRVITKINER